jgi:type I restriction enzyme S subunit
MPEELPNGWIKTTLGELVEPARERSHPGEFPDSRYVGLENIEAHTMKLLGHEDGRLVRSSGMRFLSGDLLYARMRPYLNKIWVATFDGVCSAEFLVFRQKPDFNMRFLACRLNASDFVSFSDGQTSGERPRVDFSKLSRFPILLPPLAEQGRIVTKLESAISALQRAESASERALDRLVHYRASVLNAAVTGTLTESWRLERRNKKPRRETGQGLITQLAIDRRAAWERSGLSRREEAGRQQRAKSSRPRYKEPRPPKTLPHFSLPEEWGWASVEQISTRVTVGYVGRMKNEYVAHGVPFLRSQNVRPNRFDDAGLLYISPEFHLKLEKSRILPGDVVVVRSGAVGTACVIPESLNEANCSDLVVIKHPLINAHLIAFYLNSAALTHIEQGKVGVALTHFNTASVAALGVPVPSVDEQSTIVEEVRKRFSGADKLSATLRQQLD